MDFSKVTGPQTARLLICFMDIQNFGGIAQKLADSVQIFDLLNGFAEVVISRVEATGGRVLKFIGDECLLIYPEEAAGSGVVAIKALKAECERFFLGKGFPNKLRAVVHFGEVAIGQFGKGHTQGLDILGESVNTTATLGRGEHRGRLILSPQAFRTLPAAERRQFHKHTPPIVYLAEE